MTDIERNQLVTDHLPRVRQIARKIFRRVDRRRFELDDLIQQGAIALLRAAERYRAAVGPFENFASRCVRRELLTLVKRGQDRQLEVDRLPTRTPDGRAQDGDPLLDTQDEVEHALKALTPRMANVLRARYLDGMTLKQIGPLFGVPGRSAAYELVQRALAKARTVLEQTAP